MALQFLEYPHKTTYHYKEPTGDERGVKPMCNWYEAYGPHQEQYVVDTPSDGRYLCPNCYREGARRGKWEGLKLPPRTAWEHANPR